MKSYMIRQEMAENKIKVIDIAAKFGVTHAAISSVIHGRNKTPRIRQAIADAIGRPVAEVFPDQESL